MKCWLLIACSVVLGCSLSGSSRAASADPDRMLAEPTHMFTEWQTRFALPRPDFQALRTFAGLPPLLEFYDGRAVCMSNQWLERKAELRRLLYEYFLGTPPRQAPPCKRAKTLAQTRQGSSLSRLVELTFATTPEVSFTVEILALDYVLTLPEVDRQHVAITGHSRNGIGLEHRTVKRRSPGDDDGSFVKAGYPAAIILIGSWPYGDPNYHTPEDTPERSDVPNATKQVQAALAAVLTLDQER